MVIPFAALAVFAIPMAPQGPADQPHVDAPPARQASAIRADQPVRVDGRDDDAVWQHAPRHDAFRQFSPRVNGEPLFRTEFRVAFDERNLYVFVRMYDPHPDSILHALSRRDQRGPSDQIKLIIDSYDDKRSGYELAVNPDGVKRDYVISDDHNEDDSWDGIWDVATRVDSLGWTAEYRVPLSQLRYAAAEKHTFGFGVWRDIERTNERDSWPLYDPKVNGLSSQLGRLSGLEGLASGRRVEATPYVVTKNVPRGSSAIGYSRDQQTTVGGDVKLGLTPNVTLDATLNPDFGQVEADPAVVNLSAFETFYAEKRPFFVEGTAVYQFPLNCYIVVDCSTNEGLFYSRRIGRSPSLAGLYGDATTATATNIAGAAKLTGRTAGGLSFGLLDAVTQRVGGVGGQTVEPQTNFAVLRAQQDMNGGESGLGVMATAVNRSLDAASAPYLHRSAYAVGANYRKRFHRGDYEFNAQATASRVDGSAEAIARTQRNSVHYYQQPGAGLTMDSTRTALSGHEEQVKFGKYGGGITRFESSLVRQSAGFEVNDLGYLRRADLLDWATWAALTWNDARGIYRWAGVNGNHQLRWNTNGTKLDHMLNFNGHMGLVSNWDVHAGATMANVSNTRCDRCTRGGPMIANSFVFAPWGGFNSDARKTVSYGYWFNAQSGSEGHTYLYSHSPYVTLRLSTRATATISPSYERDHLDEQWFGNFTDASQVTHYAFAHLDQTTVSMTTRVNFTATPTLTIEFYGQPFVANGTYTSFREASPTPLAKHYADRYVAYAPPASAARGFKYTSLRTNTVVRWEFRPGSTMFLVWQHGREDYAGQASTQSWYRDYEDLFSLHPNNILLLKMSYWLNR